MDFARKQLEKYGWKEGQGLGKENNGITTAIKPKLKFDNAGIGHEAGKELVEDWWSGVYDNALSNMKVNKSQKGEVSLSVKKEKPSSSKPKPGQYNSFIKTSQLTQDGIVHFDNVPDFTEPPEPMSKLKILSDDEIFAACNKRTAHKGARHGLNLSGKLSRLEKQEQLLLKKLQSVSITDKQESIEKKLKKLAKHKDNNMNDNSNDICFDDESSNASSSSIKKNKKKKKKFNKSVSFNETVTVTEYPVLEQDNSFTSSDNENILNNPTIDEINETTNYVAEKLSKAEKSLKKGMSRATDRFLDELKRESDEASLPSTLNDARIPKRKLPEDDVADCYKKCYIKRITLSDDPQEVNKKKKSKKHRKSCRGEDCTRKICQERQIAKKVKKEKKSIKTITKSLDKFCNISN